jgi:hypothetical protein
MPSAALAAVPPKTEDVVELSPFEIHESADDKWRADTTLLGNRTNQDITKVPASVEVLTKDFLADLGVFNGDDAGAFIAGVTVQPRLEARNDNGRLTFRGLSGSSNTTRNFFQWAVPSDTYNVDRFDVGLGSNSMMFGDSTPGGQIATTTKRARFLNFNEGLGFVDSLGSYRMQLDVNRKISKMLAIRVNGVNREDASFVGDSYQRFRAGDFALTYRPFTNTVISIEGERGLYQRRRADNTAQMNDVAAPGRGFGTNNRWYVTSDGEVINRTSTNPAAIDRTGASGTAYSILEGQSVGVRLPNGSQKVFNGLSRDFNILGSLDYLDRPFNVATVVIEQNIGKLSIQASYNQQFQHQDRNDNSFGASSSPPIINVDSNGRPYVDMSGSLTTYKIFGEVFKAGRLSAAYPFEFGKWMKQYMVLTATRSKDYAYNRRFGFANTAAPGLVANNALLYRAYLDDPKILSGNWDMFRFAALPRTPTFQPELVESYVNTGPFIDVRYTSNYTASLSGEYFGGRLNSTFGISYNRISRKIPIAAAYNTDPVTGRITFWGTPDSDPSYFTYDPNFSMSATNYIGGLSYQLLRGDNLTANVYGVYSQSFNWQSQLTFTGQNLGPIAGTTREVGLKGTFFHGKIGYTVSAFRIERTNAGYAWTPNSLSATQLEDLFNPNNLLPADPKYFHVETGLNNESHEINSSEKSKGFDLTLIGQRVHGVQGRVTFGKTQVAATRDFSDFVRLLNAAIARTAAANAPGGDKTQAELPSLISTAQDIVAANTNTTVVTGRRSAPYTASFVLDYLVPQVSGLRAGLTGVWTPNYNLAIFNGVVYKGGASLPLSLYAIYDRKIWGQRTSFRLGFNRVYDLMQGHSEYYKNGANSFNTARGLPNYIYRYTDPMVTTLSATVRF